MGKKILDFIVGAVLLFIAFGIMAFFPVRTSFLTWVIVVVSAFAFCFGYFRLGLVFNRPGGKGFLFVKKAIFCTAGIAMMGYGIFTLLKEDFSGRGLGIFSLNLIYGIAMEYYAFDKAMNYAVDGFKQSGEVNLSIEELYHAFRNTDTPMGRPWVGRVKNVEGDCLIYGPTDKGSFLFGYYLFGTFCFGASPLTKMLEEPEKAAAHVIETNWDRDDFGNGQLYHFLTRLLPDFYLSMFEKYIVTGRPDCDFADLFRDKTPNVFIFDEIFSVLRQRYNLLDLEGRPVCYLHGTFPFWTFRLEDAADGRELVKSRRLPWHILFPTYDIYLNQEKYGRMRWLFRILRRKFRMRALDGEIVVREMTATVGDQYGVYRDGALIGTISQKIGLTSIGQFVRDMVFDNFVIMVFDRRDLGLVASLTVMLGSFKNHSLKKE